MKQTIIILTLLLSVSCGQTTEVEKIRDVSSNESEKGTDISTESEKGTDVTPTEIALEFINAYVENLNKMNQSIGIKEWVNSSTVATKRFKSKVKSLIDEANKNDPEMGLGFDPILDAQDYPDKGFELASFDEKTNFLVVRGIDWADFEVTMKLVLENDKWLVDGCGIVNIPDDKRTER